MRIKGKGILVMNRRGVRGARELRGAGAGTKARAGKIWG